MILFVNNNKGVLFLSGITIVVQEIFEWIVYASRITTHLIYKS